MKNFDFPSKPVCDENLSGSCFQVAACDKFATSVAFSFKFGAHRSYLSHTFEKNVGMSYAELLPLFFGSVRVNTHGFPSDFPVIPEKYVYPVPSGRLTRFRILCFRSDAPRDLQGAYEMPSLFQHGSSYFFIIISAVCQDNDVPISVITDIFFEIQHVDVSDQSFMFGFVSHFVSAAILFRIKRKRCQGNDYIVENQKNIRPLMSDDESVSVIEFLNIFGFQTAAFLKCVVNENKKIPRQ
jgi:hypothetical protein